MRAFQSIVISLALWLSAVACVQPWPEKVAFINVRIIDGTGSAAMEKGVLLVAGGKITAMGRDIEIPGDFTIIDLAGKTVLPGFINCHVHDAYNAANLSEWLKSGITTVRDYNPHGSGDFITAREGFNRDVHNARLISATPIICPEGGYGHFPVDSAEKAGTAVRDFIKQGYDAVKISIEDFINNRRFQVLSLGEISRITKTAHELGIRVSAHVSNAQNLSLAIEGGVDNIEHMVVQPISEDIAKQIAEKGMFIIPTLELWQGVQNMYPVRYLDVALENVRRFRAFGGNIALGTDFAGFTCTFDRGFPITEVRLLKKAGMSAMDIIVAATKNAAIVCGRENSIGTLAPGKTADLWVIDGNPLDDIELFLKPLMVVKEGKLAFPR
jgi:imidazolonepropionase-like amidohydrolase